MRCLLVLTLNFFFQSGALTEEKYRALGTAEAVKKTFNSHRNNSELGKFRYKLNEIEPFNHIIALFVMTIEIITS